MRSKTLYISLLLLSITNLMGCHKQIIYATSEISGQIIDKKTNLPIKGVNVGISNNVSDITDKQGYFTVPPITYEYVLSSPNHRKVMSLGNASFSVAKLGYEIKSYRNGGLAFVPKPYDEKNYINMGKVYLMPVPVGTEREHMTHYSTLHFCKPNQSQKQVNCIPVPEGKTYEQVSPNQPVE